MYWGVGPPEPSRQNLAKQSKPYEHTTGPKGTVADMTLGAIATLAEASTTIPQSPVDAHKEKVKETANTRSEEAGATSND